MDANSLAFTQYWRNSLADSDLGWGALKNKDISSSTKLELKDLSRGEVPADIVRKCFEGENEKAQTVAIVVRSKVFLSKLDHGKRPYGLPEVVTPIIFSAQLARNGRIYPAPCTIPRDLLEPQELKSFAIAHIEHFDHYLSQHDLPAFEYEEATESEGTDNPATEDHYPEKWKSYYEKCEQLFVTVTKGWPSDDNRFEQANYWLLTKKDTVTGATRHILALYEHMREGNPDVPLYEQYASLDIRPIEPCLPHNAAFASRLGHASDRFALAPAQRDALSHLFAMQQGEILAVNGKRSTNPILFSRTIRWLNPVHAHSTATALRNPPPFSRWAVVRGFDAARYTVLAR